MKDFRPNGKQTSLNRAVRHADVNCVEILIDAGSEMDSYDNEGNTPLAIPLKRIRNSNGEEEELAEKYCPVVKVLSEKGAKFDAVNLHGNVKEQLKTILENCINGNLDRFVR